jgi:hypothetical protein
MKKAKQIENNSIPHSLRSRHVKRDQEHNSKELPVHA